MKKDEESGIFLSIKLCVLVPSCQLRLLIVSHLKQGLLKEQSCRVVWCCLHVPSSLEFFGYRWFLDCQSCEWGAWSEWGLCSKCGGQRQSLSLHQLRSTYAPICSISLDLTWKMLEPNIVFQPHILFRLLLSLFPVVAKCIDIEHLGQQEKNTKVARKQCLHRFFEQGFRTRIVAKMCRPQWQSWQFSSRAPLGFLHVAKALR